MPFVKRHPWLSSFVLLSVVFISLLPIGLKYTAIHLLEKHSGQQATIADIDLNIFNGKLRIRNIQLQNGNHKTQVNEFSANILLRALFQERLLFSQIKLIGVTLPVEISEQNGQQQFRVAGFAIPQESSKEESDSGTLPFGLGVQQLALQDINIQLIQAEQQQLYQIRSLSLKELYSWDSDFARLKLNSTLNQKSINANLQVHLFTKAPKIIGTIKVRELNLQDLQEWVAQPIAGQLTADLTFTVEQQSNGFKLYQYSDINLANADIQMAEQRISAQKLTWQGDAHFFSGDVQALKVLGNLNGTQLALTQNGADGAKLNIQTDAKGAIDLIGQLNGVDARIQQKGLIALNNFNLQQSHTAPQASDLTVNYQQLSYQGSVDYAIAKPKLNLDGALALNKLRLEQQSQAQKEQQNRLLELPKIAYQGKIDYDLTAQKIALNGTLNSDTLQLTQTAKNGKQLQNSLELALAAMQLDGQQHITLGDDLQLKTQSNLTLKQLTFAQQDNSAETPIQRKFSSNINAKLNLQAKFAENQQSLQQTGTIQITNLAFKDKMMSLSTPAINWNGALDWQQTAALKLSVKGDLNSDNIEFTQQTPEQSLQLSQSLKAKLDLLLNNNAKQLSLQQNGTFTLDNLSLQQSGLNQQAKQIRYSGNLMLTQNHPLENQPQSGAQDIRLKGQLQLTKSHTELAESGIKINQNLSSDFTLASLINNDTLSIDYSGSGQIAALKFKSPQQSADLDTFTWQGQSKFSQAYKQTATAAELNGQFKLSAKRLNAGSPKMRDAMQLQQLNLPSLTLKSPQHFALRNLDLSGLTLQGINQQQTVPIATLRAITLTEGDIALAPELAIELGDLALVDLNGDLTLDKDYQLAQISALLNAFGIEKQAETPTETTPQDPAKTANPDSAPNAAEPRTLPKIALASFALQGNNQIQLSIANPNTSEDAPINKRLTIKTLRFGAFDSSKPEQASDFEFLASLDEFSEIRSSGKIAPLAAQLSMQAKTAIDGLALNDFSPLVQQAVGYQIDSGQLSATIDSTIGDNKIDVENSVKLYKFQLVSADKEKTEAFDKGFSMPLEVGLSLLRDKSDNIELKLPIKGDLDNPNFNIQDVISTALNGALGKATRTYLLLALQPFGAIALVGEMAFDQLAAVRLQPVDFEDSRFKLTDEMQQYLQKVSTLLQSKSDVQIKLCGGVNQSDRQAIAQASQTESQKKENKLPEITDDQLLSLATMRQTAIKRYLLEQGVSTNQIVICQPKISNETGSAKIQMGI
ncbi:hypothetical protein THMIRHAS_01720 [Thiosulfatimonas sediminis]|uniref:OmpA-like domain-containing protein n=1 Tax=Thiosulfatimonas sediminis TaxID=2675054 RepID=A0A6F8PRR3_9GAMM|nr:DUF748 domain-containing protein [Thiosulfatimonas sediminis]BBP44799.1 hypothetical protein THMIRHAS_01720 [Thiosulfatimonas sediminis]